MENKLIKNVTISENQYPWVYDTTGPISFGYIGDQKEWSLEGQQSKQIKKQGWYQT
jgi:hypothetical protein